MLAKVTDELDVLLEACVMQPAPGVAAYRENMPDFDVVVLVKNKAMRMIGYIFSGVVGISCHAHTQRRIQV